MTLQRDAKQGFKRLYLVQLLKHETFPRLKILVLIAKQKKYPY
jgi:hypothetical protein